MPEPDAVLGLQPGHCILRVTWTVRRDDSGDEIGLWSVIDANENIVFFGMEEDRARLFAAAPELLSVAKECLELAKLAESLCGCRGDDDYVWGIQERLNATIARAEGR